MTDRQRIEQAFAKLERVGYVTRKAFAKTGFEGGILLFEEDPELEFAAFYTATPKFDWMGNLVAGCGIHWLGDPEVIAEALLETGLRVEWNGDPSAAMNIPAYTRVLAA